MPVVLYTEKTVAQALTALNARIQAKATSSRPAVDGWVEKSGRFAIGVTTEVVGRFTRTTFLHGRLERAGSYTIVKARVSRGATRDNKIVIYAALAVAGLALFAGGSAWLAALLVPVGGALYIPLTGDQRNSEYLLAELQRTLKAKSAPPKAAAGKGPAAKAGPPKPASARRAATATRPAPRKTGVTAAVRPVESAPPLFGEAMPGADGAADEPTRVPFEE